MSKYCLKCKQNFSDSFEECVYCDGELVDGVIEVADDSINEKNIFEMSDSEILDKYAEYRKLIETQTGKISDDEFIRGLKEGRRDSLCHQANSISKQNHTQDEDFVKCPKCGSTQIQIIHRKWSLLTGFMTNKVDRVCVKCKNKF